MSRSYKFGAVVIALCLLLGCASCKKEEPSSSLEASSNSTSISTNTSASISHPDTEVSSLKSEQESTEKEYIETNQLLFHGTLKATRLVYGSDKDHLLFCSGAKITNTAQVQQNEKLKLPCAAEASLPCGYSDLQYDLRGEKGEPLLFPPTSVFGMWLYIEDPEAIQTMTLSLYMDENTLGVDFQKTTYDFQEGWNLIRFAGMRRTSENWRVPTWNQIYLLRISFSCRRETTVQIGSVWAENPDKATIILIEDGGFETFLREAYPKLAARSIPVTWAVDVEKIGKHQEEPLYARITEEEYEILAKENGNRMNFHGYSGEVTATMTEEELLADNLQAVDYLLSKGWDQELMWRSAYCQNKAQNASISQTLFMATATPKAIYDMTVFPFIDPFNLPRFSLHDLYPSRMDACFQLLKQTHGFLLLYTHGISGDSKRDTTPAILDDFLAHCDEGLQGGWLQCSTFSQILKDNDIPPASGGKWITEFFEQVDFGDLSNK